MCSYENQKRNVKKKGPKEGPGWRGINTNLPLRCRASWIRTGKSLVSISMAYIAHLKSPFDLFQLLVAADRQKHDASF